MFVLEADDVSKKELHHVSKKNERQLEKWATKDGSIVNDKKKQAAANVDECVATGPACKKPKHTTEFCELVLDVDAEGSCTFNIVSKVESCHDDNLGANLTIDSLCNGKEDAIVQSVCKSSDITTSISSCKEHEMLPLSKANNSDSLSTVHIADRRAAPPSGATVSTNDVLSIARPIGGEDVRAIPDPSQYVSLDCEFVGVRNDQSVLGRCSIVDFHGNIICDIYSQPNERITCYRTRWSGITRSHMRQAIPMESALSQISDIIQGKIVVGHALFNDFNVMAISHPPEQIRDTSLYHPLRHMLKMDQPVSLKRLAKELLGQHIQNGHHCSVIDAQTTMDIYKLVRVPWEHSILDGNPPQDPPPCKKNGSAKKRKQCETEVASTSKEVVNGISKSQKLQVHRDINAINKNGKIHFGQINSRVNSVHTYFTEAKGMDKSVTKITCDSKKQFITKDTSVGSFSSDIASTSTGIGRQCSTSHNEKVRLGEENSVRTTKPYARGRKESFCQDVDLSNCGTGKSLFRDEFWPTLTFF